MAQGNSKDCTKPATGARASLFCNMQATTERPGNPPRKFDPYSAQNYQPEDFTGNTVWTRLSLHHRINPLDWTPLFASSSERDALPLRIACESPRPRNVGFLVCAEHVRQLEGESPFDNRMEVKS